MHIRALILQARGSVPREAGTAMEIRAETIVGTIGGGAFEHEVIALARQMLREGAAAKIVTRALGPELGQCCGGHLRALLEPVSGPLPALRKVLPEAAEHPPLALERLARNARAGEAPPPAPHFENGWLFEPAPVQPDALWIWGAGHIGRALATMLLPLPDFAITLADFEPERLGPLPKELGTITAANPADLTGYTPCAHHVIATHSHALDLELCHRLLPRPHLSLGMIGARTKMRRFTSRLTDLGHPLAQIERIACPLGDVTLGKHPQAIAIGIASALLTMRAQDASAPISFEQQRTGSAP